MKKKHLSISLVICALLTLFLSCNADVVDNFSVNSLTQNTIPATLAKGDCDLERIKSIKIYNYCCTSGWANLPCTFTLYTHGKSYSPNKKYKDTFFEDISIEDFEIDKWGNSIVWAPEDTGNYSGSPKILSLNKTLNLKKIERLVLTYTLDVSDEFVNGGGIQIAFVDKDGNKSENIYLNGK